MCIPSVHCIAQSSCDKVFQEGQQFQKNMTTNAQRQAIAKFEKAKICYDSQERKNICDQQIQICRNIIKTLDTPKPVEEEKEEETVVEEVELITATEVTRNDVLLSLSVEHLRFDDKAGDFQKVTVNCNYDDWVVSNKPEWISISINKAELVIEALENTDEKERAGVIEVSCSDKHVNLVVSQDKRVRVLSKKLILSKRKRSNLYKKSLYFITVSIC